MFFPAIYCTIILWDFPCLIARWQLSIDVLYDDPMCIPNQPSTIISSITKLPLNLPKHTFVCLI